MSLANATIDEEDDQSPLYEAAKKVYPQRVAGAFRRVKWAILVFALAVYYLLPFVRWDRGVNEPSQAVLVDFEHRRFYFFFIELWPQEVYFFTGLLIVAALILFLMNAVAGRVWCGYLCPQTVWTDLFFSVERWIEGDRRERMRKDAGPWTRRRVAEKTAKHTIWLVIAWWTGGAWVLYFADAPTLVHQLATLTAPPLAYAAIATLTFTTYVLAGHLRDQVCFYMCPWPRIQAALTDEHALNVTYRFDRGEPRNSIKKAAALREVGAETGDCIDCKQCIAVCPTGVDIRGGANLGCIQCGLCIDACDSVMRKIGREPKLIAYDTDVNIKRRQAGLAPVYLWLRPRTLLYAGLIVIVSAVMLFALVERSVYGVAVIHDRNPLFVRLSSGAIRNAYLVRLTNKESEAKRFSLSVTGLADPVVGVVGAEFDAWGNEWIEVGPDRTREVRVLVTTNHAQGGSVPLVFAAKADDGKAEVQSSDHFWSP